MDWKNTMATDHTDGEPPSSGSTMRANIGCTPKRSRALRNTAAVKRPNINVPLRAMGAKSVESRDILIPDG